MISRGILVRKVNVIGFYCPDERLSLLLQQWKHQPGPENGQKRRGEWGNQKPTRRHFLMTISLLLVLSLK